MKLLISSLVLILILCDFACSQEKPVYANKYIVKTGDYAPDFMIKETDGKEYKLSYLKGKVVMLQFMVGWCGVYRKDYFSYTFI